MHRRRPQSSHPGPWSGIAPPMASETVFSSAHLEMTTFSATWAIWRPILSLTFRDNVGDAAGRSMYPSSRIAGLKATTTSNRWIFALYLFPNRLQPNRLKIATCSFSRVILASSVSSPCYLRTGAFFGNGACPFCLGRTK